MDELTTQEVYENTRDYFSRPGAVLAKTQDRHVCQYRTPEGNKCAVGCNIPDELYDRLIFDGKSRLEGKNIDGILNISSELDAIINGDSEEGKRKYRFLRNAQYLHDSRAKDAADFVRLLDALALGYDLDLY